MHTTKSIIEQIYLYGKKKYAFLLIGNFLRFFLLFFVLWLSISLADSVFYFSGITRWGLIFINVPIVLFFFFKLVVTPFLAWINLKKNSDFSKTALEIGEEDGSIADHLVNFYQLAQKKTNPIINAALSQMAWDFKNTAFSEKINFRQYLPSFKIAIPVFLSAFVLIVFQWGELSTSSMRLLNPSKDYLRIPAFHFNVLPGNKDILQKQALDIVVDYTGPDATQIEMYIFSEKKKGAIRKINLEKRKGKYSTRLKEILVPFSYAFSAIPVTKNELSGKLVSETYHISVLVPPQVQDLSLKMEPPFYSRKKTAQNELNDGNITCLAGSKIKFKISANKSLQSAYITFSDLDTLFLRTKGKLATGEFNILKTQSYKINLVDLENLQNRNPITYTVTVLPDNPPYVDIVEPGEDVEAQLEDILGLKVNAADDYGLRNVFINFRYLKNSGSSDTLWQRLDLDGFVANKAQLEIRDYFDFTKMYVGYGDALEYFAVAIDNNAVGGFSKSESPIYRVTFPSLTELFDEFTESEQEKVDDLEDVVQESEELKQKLDEIDRELKRTEKMDWELKKQIENSLEQQKAAQEKIEKVQQELEEMIEKLDKNSLMNPEIMEKYSQLQNLFQEIATPELLEAMKKLEQAMESTSQKEVQKALENFKNNQAAFQANLERTLELFKQVQLEQQMDQLVQQAEKLAENQKKISNALKEAQDQDKQSVEQLQTEQKQQEDLLSALKRNLEDVLKKEQLEKFQSAKDKLQQTKSEINKQNLKEEMDRMQQNMQKKDMQQAGKKSQNMQKSFQEMQQNLNQAMQNLKQQNKQDVEKKMLAATRKMLKLSYEQERIQKETKQASQLNDDIKQAARKQAHLQENLKKLISDLVQLSKETFFLNPDMSKNMANAQNSMQKSLEGLSERRNAQAAGDQQRAMAALNRGLSSMQKSMQQMSGSQSGTGFEQFMEQLKQMAGAQGSLNSETMNFMQGQGQEGQMSMQQQAGAKRLAAQQKAIQQGMQEMADQMGNRSDMLGRLNEMGEQMDEIVQDMLANNVNRKTINRQQQILSRMLDAQKSVREREFSKKRKAEQAKKYFAKDPGKLKDFENMSQKQIREALKKALSEGYYNDYQKLIEAYFKELSAKQGKN